MTGRTPPVAGGPPEQATSVSAAALLSSLEGQEKHELDDIVDALARLEGGTYGLCQSCGRSIRLVRLRAMPAARYCVGCQVGREHRP
jgi:RNA polymerase-binding transcription factor DksA